jgi:ketosteroid isomerase-like protein
MEKRSEVSEPAITLLYRSAPEDPEVVARNRKMMLDALDGIASGDAEAFWSIFDPDVVFHEAACLPYGGAHHGIAATRRAFDRIHEVFSQARNALEAVLAAGDIVMLYQTITFCVRENGNSGSFPVAELFRFRNSKVVEWRALYFDSHMVAQAISGARGEAGVPLPS